VTKEHAMNKQIEVARTEPNGEIGAQENGRAASAETALRPAVDIFETEEGITVQADMPGVSRDRLNLRIDGTNLLIEGRIGVSPQDQMQALYADVRSAVYRRNFLLSSEFEASKIDANLKDGVLTVRIPKRAELRPRRIEVRTT
jgi:HSP20 family molecular chaperone IbpA